MEFGQPLSGFEETKTSPLMKDSLVHLESSLRSDPEGPASPTDALSSVVLPPGGSGPSEGRRFQGQPSGRRRASTGTTSVVAPLVRPPTPPLRGERGAAFRAFVPRGTEIRGTETVQNDTNSEGSSSSRRRQSSFQQSSPREIEPGSPIRRHQHQQQREDQDFVGSGQRIATPLVYVDGQPKGSEVKQRSSERNPLAFLLQVAKERTKYLEEEKVGASSVQQQQKSTFHELHLEHRESSKKYQEDLKKNSAQKDEEQEEKEEGEEMVRKHDPRFNSHAFERPPASGRFHHRIISEDVESPDNTLQGGFFPMASSGTQTPEQLNGNVEVVKQQQPTHHHQHHHHQQTHQKQNSPMTPTTTTTSGTSGSGGTLPMSAGLLNSNNLSSIYHGDWPIERVLWNSAPSSFGENDSLSGLVGHDTSSIMSFSSNHSSNSFNGRKMNNSSQPFGTKVEMVYSLLSMLGATDREDMSKTLLAMSQSPESCIAMRQSGCLFLLVQLLHSNEDANASTDDLQAGRRRSRESRRRATSAMHNIVHAYVDDKQGRRETRVLRLLEQIRNYCDHLQDIDSLSEEEEEEENCPGFGDQHLGPAIATLMKLSFDEDHRNAMCQLGGLHAIAELIEVDQAVRGNTSEQFSVTLRRYAGMALTNLTFGDGTNKALLCSLKPFMFALVAQLFSPSEDLRQVTASVLRNLSWRADTTSKQILREVGAVTTLMKASMEATKESTLKSILSALWNLSAHCSANKVDICTVDGALAFLVTTLSHKNPAIVENGGGILRNISSHIAVHEEHRAVLRKHNCLQILLQHLKSSSLTVVSNACGTLWNLSARCVEDQKALWDMGAVDMLRNLVHSKHKMISMGSSAALKNLVSSKPSAGSTAPVLGSRPLLVANGNMPSLLVRKQRALEEEIDQTLSETCDNIDSPKSSPTHRSCSLDNRFLANGNYPPYSYTYLPGRMYHSINGHIPAQPHHVPRSESRESVGSTQSEPGFHSFRNTYYNFTRNRRFASMDHRYYPRTLDEQQRRGFGIRVEDYCPVNPAQSGPHRGPIVDRMTGSYHVTAERQPRSPEKKRRSSSDDLTKSEPKNGVPDFNKNVSQNGFHQPPNGSGNAWQSSESFPKRSSWHHQEMQEKPIDYSRKYDEPEVELLKKKHNNSTKRFLKSESPSVPHQEQKVNNYVFAKNEMNSIEKEQRSSEWQRQQQQQQSSSNVATSFTNKRTLSALRKSGQECSLEFHHLENYAETDLDDPDQPTDYSQKYKEQSEEYETKFSGDESTDKLSSCHEDSLKVYCTEGTPLNFSSASSMTDLREINSTLASGTTSDITSTPPHLEQQQRVNKLQVIKEVNKSEIEKNDVVENKHFKSNTAEKEGKSVTFGHEVDYAVETPLMFSRCSSMGSLNSFEQHSIHDDRSSVISDFSRRASEVVSPSDLPDSPSQTMPPSPRRQKNGAIFNFVGKAPSDSQNCGIACPRPISAGPTILEAVDEVSQDLEETLEEPTQVFNEEGTPVEFSCATSLSSLTIDDEFKIVKEPLEVTKPVSKTSDVGTPRDSSSCQGEEASDSDTNDEDLLAACINSGMPNNRTNNNNNVKNNNNNNNNNNNIASGSRNGSLTSIPLAIPKSGPKNSFRQSCHLPKAVVAPLTASSGLLFQAVGNRRIAQEKVVGTQFDDDYTKQYQTEGTPSILSHAGSLSELSLLSGLDGKSASSVGETHSDSSSSVCDDNDNLLQQCIQSGMPKSKIPSLSKSLEIKTATSVPKSKLPTSVSRFVSTSSETSSENCLSQRPQIPHGKPQHISSSSHACGFARSWSKPQKEQPLQQQRYTTNHLDPKTLKSTEHREMEASRTETRDIPRLYNIEGTPIVFSRNDSLSSLSCEEDTRLEKSLNDKTREGSQTFQSHIPKASDRQSLTTSSTPIKSSKKTSEENEMRHSFGMEGTPVCFSRNSSLSSLSVESLDEPSTSEQALLEECINSGKPKDRKRSSSRGRSKNAKRAIPVLCKPYPAEEPIYKPVRREGSSEGIRRQSSSSRERSRDGSRETRKSVEGEEKIKEDEMTKENVSKGESQLSSSQNDYKESRTTTVESSSMGVVKGTYLPPDDKEDEDLVLTVTIASSQSKKMNSPPEMLITTEMSESVEFRREATRLAEKVEAEGEDLTHSSISCFSDLDNVKPPSVMGELLSLSMNSSGFSEIERGTWKKDTRRQMPETVRRALGGGNHLESLKISACSDNMLDNVMAPSCMGSIENLSMRSSFTSELLENVNPPSAMDLLTRTGSCTSLNSISSDILESRSPSLADMPNLKSNGGNSEMFQRLNAAAAMVQVYSRELSNIMNGTNNSCNGKESSSNSEMIDHVKPPSVFVDIAEMTIEDRTEMVTDNMASDTEMEEELPRDEEATEVPSTDTLKGVNRYSSLAKGEEFDGSTENLSTLIEDSPRRRMEIEAPTLEPTAEESSGGSPQSEPSDIPPLALEELNIGSDKMEISAEDFKKLQADAHRVVSTLLGKTDYDDDFLPTSCGGGASVGSDKMLEDETISLFSNDESDREDSDEEEINNETYHVSSPKAPRIVKPLNRDAIRKLGLQPMGKAASQIRPPLAVVKPREIVAPSTLKTIRSNNVIGQLLRPGQKKYANKPPAVPLRKSSNPNYVEDIRSQIPPEVPAKPKFSTNTFTRTKSNSGGEGKTKTDTSCQLPTVDVDENRPKLVKQRTFTKDSPTHSSCNNVAASPEPDSLQPEASSSSSSPGGNDSRQHFRRMSYGGVATVTSSIHQQSRRSGYNLESPSGGVTRSLTRQDEPRGGKARRSPSTSSLGSIQSTVGGSNVSLSSNSSSGTRKSKSSPTKKEVTSKIAVIWKRSSPSDLGHPPKVNTKGATNGAITSGPSMVSGVNGISGKAKIVKPVSVPRNSRL